jgi:hypothetical protein
MVDREVVPFYVSAVDEKLPRSSAFLVTCRSLNSHISVHCDSHAARVATLASPVPIRNRSQGCTFNASSAPHVVYAAAIRGPAMVPVLCTAFSGNDTIISGDSVNVSVLALLRPIVAGLDGVAIEPCNDLCQQRQHQSRLEIITSTTKAVVLNTPADGSGMFAQEVSAKLRRVDRSGEAENLKLELPLTINNVSNTSLVVTLPLFNETCGQNGSICYFAIEIQNPSVIDSVTAGGAFICPDPNRSNYPSERCDGDMVAQAAGTIFFSVRYVSACAGFEPPGQACLEPDSSDNTPCAFGFRDGCTRCPRGGICPGGNEVRSQVGCDALPRMLCHSHARIGAHAACICGIRSAICRYFVAFAEVAEVMRCPPPATTRCLGWDPVSKTTICGSTLAGAPDALCLLALEAAAGSGIGVCVRRR